MPHISSLSKKIRFRLLTAFGLIGAMAATLAIYAWTSTTAAERKMEEVIAHILPLVQHSGELSRQVSYFAVTISELTTITTREDLESIYSELQLCSQKIKDTIANLHASNIKSKQVKDIQQQASRLISKLDEQYKLSLECLTIRATLQAYLGEVQERRRELLPSGVIPRALTGTEQDVKQRRPLSLFLCLDILFQAANAASAADVNELSKEMKQRENIINDLKKTAERGELGEYEISSLAGDLLADCRADNPVFDLRRRELTFITASRNLAAEAIEMSEHLGEDIAKLSQASRKQTHETLAELHSFLQRYRLYSGLAAAVTLCITICIGLLYVKNRVTKRIGSLRDVMDQQAQGLPVPIPADTFGDEISDMTSALAKFISQREAANNNLEKTLLYLNEAQQLAKIGTCERNHLTTSWRWSDGFYHLLGYRPEELAATEDNFLGTVHPRDRKRVEQFLNTLSSTTQPTEIELRMFNKEGDLLTVTGLWKLTDDSEAYTQHGIFQDITEQRKLIEDVSTIQRKKSIAILAGGIAHDFNNLLTGIMGNIALASRVEDDRTKLLEYLHIAEDACMKAKELTSRLLVFSNGGALSDNITQLPKLLKETVAAALQSSDTLVTYDLTDPLWLIDMDPVNMRQIVENLIVNASQAMGESGRIRIICRNRVVKPSSQVNLAPGRYVMIIFRDQGQGIAPANIDKIFDPYYTTKNIYTDKGSGLGLAIVHAIITRHGGSIVVKSKVGRGTSFILHLPAVEDIVQQQAPRQDFVFTRGSGLVLVMDDEELIRQVAGHILTDLGYTVDTAAGGEQLLQLYDSYIDQGKAIRAVILDLTIPGGMGGEETIQRLLKKHPTAKAIVSSGYSTDEVVENYLQYGFYGTITKPYRPEELAEVIAEVTAMEKR